MTFSDGSWLDFMLIVNQDLEATYYKFHYGTSDNKLIWRLDRHEGHKDMLSHIHLSNGRQESHDEVEIDDVLDKIGEHLASSLPTTQGQTNRPRRRSRNRRRGQ